MSISEGTERLACQLKIRNQKSWDLWATDGQHNKQKMLSAHRSPAAVLYVLMLQLRDARLIQTRCWRVQFGEEAALNVDMTSSTVQRTDVELIVYDDSNALLQILGREMDRGTA